MTITAAQSPGAPWLPAVPWPITRLPMAIQLLCNIKPYDLGSGGLYLGSHHDVDGFDEQGGVKVRFYSIEKGWNCLPLHWSEFVVTEWRPVESDEDRAFVAHIETLLEEGCIRLLADEPNLQDEKENPVVATETNRKRATAKPDQARKLHETNGHSETKSPARETNSASRETIVIPLEKLHPHPQNRVIDIPSCAGLAESLKERGQLTPILVRPMESVGRGDGPVGHYQIVGGERRYRAAMIAGVDELLAHVRWMSDPEALELLSIENGQREDLDAIEKGRQIAQLCEPIEKGGAGMTRAAAGKIFGVSDSQASNLVGLLRLPDEWQAKVRSGDLPQTFARELVRYGEHPQLVKAISFSLKNEEKYSGPPSSWSRDDFISQVESAVNNETEHISGGYEQDAAFELTDELRERLKIIELPPADKGRPPELRALNVKLYKELQAKAEKKKAKASPHDAAEAGGRGAKQAPLTPAELKAKAQEAALRTAKAVEKWRLIFLRHVIAEVIDTSKYARVMACWNIFLLSRPWEVNANRCENAFRAAIVAAGGKLPGGYGNNILLLGLVSVEPNRRYEVNERAARDLLRDDDIELPAQVVEGLAREADLDLPALWSRSQKASDPLRPLFERFFHLHTREQLVALGKELGQVIPDQATKGGAVKLFLGKAMHSNIALPKAIKPLAEPRKQKKGKAKR